MGKGFHSLALAVVRLLQSLAFIILIAITIFMLAWTALAAFGVWPWLGVSLRLGDTAIPNAGQSVQIGLTAFSIALCVFLPANARILKLEKAHRTFAVDMEDIAKAYQISHQSDRKGVFTLSEQFDTVRERLLHLRNHPDLGHLEPEILDLAAQMSFQSRDLAKVYSEDKVARAQVFLTHRQQEAEQMADRLTAARHTCDELRRWLEDVEAEERVAAQQLKRLEADLFELLPRLGYELDADPNIVKLDPKSGKSARKSSDTTRPNRLS